MVRPCFLVIDPEHAGSISTRKLVIETAKLNVITAYGSAEAIETLERYPAVNGIVLDAGMRDMPCGELVARLKQLQPKTPIVVVGGARRHECGKADHFLESFDPKKLLEVVQGITPEQVASIEQHDEELASQA